MTEPTLIPGFDHATAPSLLTRHYDEWARLRDELGCFRSDIGGDFDLWYVLRHADAHEVLRDPGRFSSRTMQYVGDGDMQRMIPVQLDPPEHGPYRQLLTARFSPAYVAGLEPTVRRRCGELIDTFFERGGCDYTTEFAFRLPTSIFLGMMGLDVDRTDEFVGLSRTMLETSNEADPDFSVRAGALFEIIGHLATAIEARRVEPRDDLLTLLLQAELDGQPLSDDDLMSGAFMLYIGGLDTVANLLSYAMRHLAEHPDLRRSLVAEPARWPSAGEEFLRFYGITSVVRTVVEDTEISGCPMKAGDRIVAPMASSGRDPEAFERAELFDPDRAPNRHMAFGAGPHRCLGAHLARLELKVSMEEWHARIPDYRLDGSVPIHEHVGAIAGLGNLPLIWAT
jgi:cytochrome P450